MMMLLRFLSLLVLLLPAAAAPAVAAEDLSKLIRQVKPSIVAIATFQATRRPPVKIMATGFAVADGHHVVTNNHTIPKFLDTAGRERLVVLSGRGRKPRLHPATVAARDPDHDTAVLKIEGKGLPVLRLGPTDGLAEGNIVAFTGFPVGAVLELFPVTHRGMVSAITPIVIPARRSEVLDPKMIRRLNDNFTIYQLDATAYPGNSGSPLYDLETGRVHAIVNSVFVKGLKEKAITNPSGIAYAIPIKYARELLKKLGLQE